MRIALNLLVKKLFQESTSFSEKIFSYYLTKNTAQSLALCDLLRKNVENELILAVYALYSSSNL